MRKSDACMSTSLARSSQNKNDVWYPTCSWTSSVSFDLIFTHLCALFYRWLVNPTGNTCPQISKVIKPGLAARGFSFIWLLVATVACSSLLTLFWHPFWFGFSCAALVIFFRFHAHFPHAWPLHHIHHWSHFLTLYFIQHSVISFFLCANIFC